MLETLKLMVFVEENASVRVPAMGAVRVYVDNRAPASGVKDSTTGSDSSTVKDTVSTLVPPVFVTATATVPRVRPAGIVAVICVAPSTVKSASDEPNVT